MIQRQRQRVIVGGVPTRTHRSRWIYRKNVVVHVLKDCAQIICRMPNFEARVDCLVDYVRRPIDKRVSFVFTSQYGRNIRKITSQLYRNHHFTSTLASRNFHADIEVGRLEKHISEASLDRTKLRHPSTAQHAAKQGIRRAENTGNKKLTKTDAVCSASQALITRTVAGSCTT